MSHTRHTRLSRDCSGIAQLEYVILLVFVTLPFYLALLPIGAALFHHYVRSRDLVLQGMP